MTHVNARARRIRKSRQELRMAVFIEALGFQRPLTQREHHYTSQHVFLTTSSSCDPSTPRQPRLWVRGSPGALCAGTAPAPRGQGPQQPHVSCHKCSASKATPAGVCDPPRSYLWPGTRQPPRHTGAGDVSAASPLRSARDAERQTHRNQPVPKLGFPRQHQQRHTALP